MAIMMYAFLVMNFMHFSKHSKIHVMTWLVGREWGYRGSKTETE